jgi:alpha-1,2-mannosyltransferase
MSAATPPVLAERERQVELPAAPTRHRQRAPIAVLLAATALISVQTLLRGHLTGIDEYDDGVYFGAAQALVHGVLPYSDFALIQPPGIAVALSPFALAVPLVGTAHAFAAARLLVALVAILNVWLVGRLGRSLPTPQRVSAMAIMAVYPGAVSSAQTVLIEPLLVFLCLTAMAALFDGMQLSTSRVRHAAGGMLMGAAIATKIWAIAPLIVLVLIVAAAGRRSGDWAPERRFTLGAGAGFAVICAPFAVAAPGAFVHQIFVLQAIRPTSGYTVPERLADMSGFAGLVHTISAPGAGRTIAAATILTAFLMGGAIVAYRWRATGPVPPLQRAALWSSVIVCIALLAAPTYYYHYSGFIAPFLALSSTRFVACLTAARRQPETPADRPRRTAVATLAMLGLAIPAIAAADVATMLRAPRPQQVTAEFRSVLPANGCILYVEPSFGLLANRFTTGERGCPAVVDYLGAERVLDSGRAQQVESEGAPAVQRTFLRWLQASNAVVVGSSTKPSWGAEALAYVANNFVRIAIPRQGVVVYVRTSSGDADR